MVFRRGVDPSLDDSDSKSSHDSLVGTDNVPIDFGRALEEFEGDKKFLMVVIDGFLKQTRNQIESIRRALSDGDSEVVMREAHSMKGGAATLTADMLSGIADELERIGESGLLEKGSDVLNKVEQELHRLEAYVKDI